MKYQGKVVGISQCLESGHSVISLDQIQSCAGDVVTRCFLVEVVYCIIVQIAGYAEDLSVLIIHRITGLAWLVEV